MTRPAPHDPTMPALVVENGLWPADERRHRGTAHSVKTINLALQGGGSHGAFTWGVLDYLLEDRRIAIEGVSGTSAGAMNAAVMASAFVGGGAQAAREALELFWRKVAGFSWLSPVHRTPVDRMLGNWNTDHSPGFLLLEAMSNAFSPYQLNPGNFNLLRDILGEVVDFAALAEPQAPKLFISATNVRSGRNRIFSGSEVTLDALLASACLPNVFQAVEIEGDPYWDGGYTGNPPIWPIIYNCHSPDVVIVQINPLERPGTPRSSAEIMNRLNEVTFNFALVAEMRAVAFVQKLITEGQISGPLAGRLRNMHVHRIAAEDEMRALGVSSKYNSDLDFLLHLKELGRERAQAWVDASWAEIGRSSTVDIRGAFLGEGRPDEAADAGVRPAETAPAQDPG